MAILKSFVLIVFLAGAGYVGYRFLRGNPYKLQQFHSIMTLTPEQLETDCGSPVQDSRGVVVENDGIRDLLYRDVNGAALVFRFISEDGMTWQSLGAWEQVNAPYDMGDPIPATKAASRMPCAAKTNASAFGLTFRSGGTASSLAVLIQDMPLTLPRSMPAPIHPPTPVISDGSPAASSPSSDPASRSSRKPRVRSVAEDEFGPGPEEPNAPRPGGTHCPTKDPCALFGYSQFVNTFKQAIQAEQENNFQRATALLTEHGIMVVQLPAAEVSRASQVKAIVQLELRAINIVEARLHDDVVHLEPVETQSTEMKSKKMVLVENDDLQRRNLWKYAVEANRPSAGTNFSDTGSTFRFNSDGYLQLVQLHMLGNWPQPQ